MLETARLLRSLFPILITIVAQNIQFLRLALSFIITSIERTPDTKYIRRQRATTPIAHEQISVVIDGRSIVEAYTKRRLLDELVIRHPQDGDHRPLIRNLQLRISEPNRDIHGW